MREANAIREFLRQNQRILLWVAAGLFWLNASLSGEEVSPAGQPAEENARNVPQREDEIVIPAAPPAPMRALGTVVALVNGEAITLDELQRESTPILEAWRKRMPPTMWPSARERIVRNQLEALIDRKLILLEAKELGAQVDESRVREAIYNIPELRRTYNGDLAKFLLAKGLTYRQLYRDIEEYLLFNGVLREKVTPKVRVSPAEVEQYYQQHIEQFTEEAAVHCFAITFMKREDPEQAAAVLTKAREALRKVREGAFFPDVAREYSEDPVRAEKGGEWGWITPGTLETKASEAAFGLKPGEYSGIVEGDAAYWILWVKDKRERSIISLSAAWREIELAIRAQKRDFEIRRWGQRLRVKAAVTYPISLSEILSQ